MASVRVSVNLRRTAQPIVSSSQNFHSVTSRHLSYGQHTQSHTHSQSKMVTTTRTQELAVSSKGATAMQS